MATDWKNIGTGALDVVVGIGSAVAGAYAGSAGAAGIQMAGGGIKRLAQLEDSKSPADKFERGDFGTREKLVEQRRIYAVISADDELSSRAELQRLGYSEGEIGAILAGKQGGAGLDGNRAAAASPAQILGAAGSPQKGAQPQPIVGAEGENTNALASIGKLISGALAGKG